MYTLIWEIDKDSFILDGISTWPIEIKSTIISNESILRKYLTKESAIDKQAREDVNLRIDRPSNKYKDNWLSLLKIIEEKLRFKKIVAFHCTRITEYEREDILKNWLMPLCPDFSIQRLKRIFEEGIISEKTYKIILDQNESNAYNRKGNVCFFHCLSNFKDELWIYRLLKSRGGEALYCNHEYNKEVIDELNKISKPCIVVACLEYSELNSSACIPEKMIKLMIDEGRTEKINHCFDSFIKHIVKVDNIITIDNDHFEKLTNYKIRNNKIHNTTTFS